MKRILFPLSLVLYCSCTNKTTLKDVLTDSCCHEWKLHRAKLKKSNAILTDGNRMYLSFHKDDTYDIYHKKGNIVGDNRITDVFVTHWWSVDASGNLHLSDFKDLKLVHFNEKEFVFKSRGIHYYFGCVCQEQASRQ